MRVAVTGGTGLVGRFVVGDLLDNGHDVRVLARSHAGKESFGARQNLIDFCFGDMQDTQSIDSLVFDRDAVVHTAFSHLPGRFRGGEGDHPVDFWRANFIGTVSLIERARQAGVHRVVLFSSRAVFDGLEYQSEEISDHELPRPTTHYGLLKASSEQLAELYDSIGICSLRPTGIYGVTVPTSKTKWWKLLTNHINEAGNIAVDRSSRTEVHGSDVASAVSILLNSPAIDVRGKSFNCSDIVTSERRVLELAQRIVNEGPNPPTDDLPPVEKPRNTMSSSGLMSLGWRPGGPPKLVETLSEIVELAGLRR